MVKVTLHWLDEKGSRSEEVWVEENIADYITAMSEDNIDLYRENCYLAEEVIHLKNLVDGYKLLSGSRETMN